MSNTSNSLSTANAPTLPEVLQKTQAAKHQLEANSRDLFVVNEVLKHEIPDPIKATGEVANALERSESIQSDLETVAENLDDANKALAEEVARRKTAEKKLTETKADLAEAKAQLADPTDHD
jgi:chromosome segregation ATPase